MTCSLLKIVLTSPTFFPHSFGGGEQYVLCVARELQKKGHQVEVLTQCSWEGEEGKWLVQPYCYEGIVVSALGFNPRFLSPFEQYGGIGPLLKEAFSAELDRLEPDLVHINGLKPLITTLCVERGLPHLVTAHHAGITCPAGGWIREDGNRCHDAMGSHCVLCCNWWRRPKWYTGGIIGRIPGWLYRPLGEWLNRKPNLNYLERGLIYPWFVEQMISEKRMVLKNAQCLVSPSRFMADLLEKNGCPAEKIRIIPHGIEALPRFDPPALEIRPLRFGYVGRIEPLKGVHTLLEAAQLLGDASCELHIYGAARNPRDEAYFRSVLKGYQGKVPVVEHGLLPHNRIAEAYRDIDVLVVPSHVPESFGFVVLEAFSAGRPVIVFDSGALSELVRDGVDGFVAASNSAGALAENLGRFLADPGLARTLAQDDRDDFSVELHVTRLEEIYQSII